LVSRSFRGSDFSCKGILLAVGFYQLASTADTP